MKTMLVAAAAATALTRHRSGRSRDVPPVVFGNGGERLVGDLFLPDGHRAGTRLPAVVVTGAWMTVKEQMPARYAAELADRGYAALAFDFRGWGQSEGGRRQVENPEAKISDIKAAFTFLASRPEVDASRLAGLGICASSGYMVHAVASLPAAKSVALVAPWLHDREIVEQTYGGADGVAKLLAAGDEAQADYKASARQTFVPAASLTDKRAIMFGAPYYTEADRGLIPEWRNEADPSFWRGWLTFDAVDAAPRLRQPFLMVHSNAAAIPQGARRFYGRVTAPKSELWLDKVGQLDFYDRAEPVTRAADAVAAHFARTLAEEANHEPQDRNRRHVRRTRSLVNDARADTRRVHRAHRLESVATLADLREFEALEKLYAPEVRVDYTSLAGGEPEVKSAAALMTQWAGVLPALTAPATACRT
jgi:fermentation-respiration switch protein FrsA (DUF1100 family)